MHDNDHDTVANVRGSFTPFILGAITGGIAALLLTPKSGPEMRRSLRDGAEKATAEAKARTIAATEKAAEKYREASQATREFVDDSRNAAKTRSQAIKDAFEEGKAAYRRELEKAS